MTANRNSASADEALRAAAMDLLHEAATAPAGRETALALLTADALMTYACEAVAERQPGRLSGLQ